MMFFNVLVWLVYMIFFNVLCDLMLIHMWSSFMALCDFSSGLYVFIILFTGFLWFQFQLIYILASMLLCLIPIQLVYIWASMIFSLNPITVDMYMSFNDILFDSNLQLIHVWVSMMLCSIRIPLYICIIFKDILFDFNSSLYMYVSFDDVFCSISVPAHMCIYDHTSV